MADFNKKHNRFTLFQFVLKCYISIALTVFTYSWLIKIGFINNAIYYVINKLEWSNYGTWVWFIVGAIIGTIWHLAYEYKNAKKGKENCGTTSIQNQ